MTSEHHHPPNGTLRDLGALEARQSATELRLASIEADLKQVLLYVTTIKGLAQVLIALASSVTLIAAILEIVRFFHR